MVQRGRKSVDALTTRASVVSEQRRLAPPTHLSDAERSVWLQVVNDQPAASFSPTYAPLLELYCRHIVSARVLAEEIAAFDRAWMADTDGLHRFDKLLSMAEREGRAASSLATRLRITRQAIDHPTTVGRAIANAPTARKPWELPAPRNEECSDN